MQPTPRTHAEYVDHMRAMHIVETSRVGWGLDRDGDPLGPDSALEKLAGAHDFDHHMVQSGEGLPSGMTDHVHSAMPPSQPHVFITATVTVRLPVADVVTDDEPGGGVSGRKVAGELTSALGDAFVSLDDIHDVIDEDSYVPGATR